MNTTTTTRILGKTLSLAGLMAAALLATSAQAIGPIVQNSDIIKPGLPSIRGPISLALNAPDTGKAAECPRGYTGAQSAGKFSCSKEVVQLANIKCPALFPKPVGRNVTGSGAGDRDLCTKNNVTITSDGSLANFAVGVDYVRVPLRGVGVGPAFANGASFVEGHPTVSLADGWHLNANAVGVTDRYRRVLTVFADPVLVQR